MPMQKVFFFNPKRPFQSMLKTIRKTVENASMLAPGDHLLLAVSGGPDSVALMRVLTLLSAEYQLHLTTAHLNHGLRGAESKGEEEFVRDLCTGLGMACICKTVDIRALQRGSGRSLEETCREERYRFLDEAAEMCGARKIATGHHRDDQAETVLINLLRGSGLEGLKGIKPVRDGRIVRPLLNVGKKEILEFLNREGLTYMIDSSNLAPLFLRNRIRNELIPYLKAHYNPQIVTGLCRMAEIIRCDDDYLQNAVRHILHRWGIIPGKDEILLPIYAFQRLHVAIQRRIIKFLLETGLPSGNGVGYHHIEAVLALAQSSYHKCTSLDLPVLIRVEKEESTLRIKRVNTRQARKNKNIYLMHTTAYSYPVEVPGIVHLREIDRHIHFEFVDNPGHSEMTSHPRVGFLDYSRISPPLVLRNFAPGDRIEPLGMTKTKKIKTFLIDRKVPRQSRGRIPLLVDTQSVLWIAGELISNRVKVTEQTKKVLRAEMV
jgi:tRNA(Ile)-lysidine synthase